MFGVFKKSASSKLGFSMKYPPPVGAKKTIAKKTMKNIPIAGNALNVLYG